jgi:dephospho-CoA kinase
MKKPLIIGITGGIGGGKSTLSDKLCAEGYEVFNTDIRAKALQNEQPELIRRMKALFGEAIYKDSVLDRAALAQIVFGNKELLLELNKLVHPFVREDFNRWVAAHSDQKLLFVESAIMFESGLVALVDKVILMTASEDIRIKRVVKRDGISPEQVKARIASQMSDELKIPKSDFVIFSDDNQPLVDKMHGILEELLKLTQE